MHAFTHILQDVIVPSTPFTTAFIYDPKRRITAKEALKHPWFNEAIRDDGTEALRLRLAKEDERRRVDVYADDVEDEIYDD